MDKVKGTLVYVQINQPVAAFVKAGEPAKPKEWKASIVLTDEDEVDAFEAYANSLGANTSIKKVKATEFENKYKTPVPEDAGKNVWVLTFRKSTELGKTGAPVPAKYVPRVMERVGNTLIDVTNTKLPANGSKGSISLDLFKRTDGTHNIFLKNVLVTDMIEYEGKASTYNPGDEFGDDEEAEAAVEAPAKPAKATAAKPTSATPAKATKPAKAEVDPEDPPF